MPYDKKIKEKIYNYTLKEKLNMNYRPMNSLGNIMLIGKENFHKKISIFHIEIEVE